MYGHFAFHASSKLISARLLPDLTVSSASVPSRCRACDCMSSRQ